MAKRRTPPPFLSQLFHGQAMQWYRKGGEPVPGRLEGRGITRPACWLHQFDEQGRPCSKGKLEAFHFIGRQRIRNALWPHFSWAIDEDGAQAFPPPVVEDLIELAEWDSRNAGPACTEHHRRFDSHATPELRVPASALPLEVIEFAFSWGLDIDAARKFEGFPERVEALVQDQLLAGEVAHAA